MRSSIFTIIIRKVRKNSSYQTNRIQSNLLQLLRCWWLVHELIQQFHAPKNVLEQKPNSFLWKTGWNQFVGQNREFFKSQTPNRVFFSFKGAKRRFKWAESRYYRPKTRFIDRTCVSRYHKLVLGIVNKKQYPYLVHDVNNNEPRIVTK